MSRVLLVSGAAAAALLGGSWVQTTRAPAPAPGSVRLAAPVAATTAPAPGITPAAKVAAPRRAGAAIAPGSLASGMRLDADPLPGQAQPADPGPALTIGEVQALVRQQTADLVTVRHPDGSETLNHEGRFLDVTVLRVGADGRPQFLCVHGELGLEHVLGTPHPAPAPVRASRRPPGPSPEED